jgi:hypothetical protein
MFEAGSFEDRSEQSDNRTARNVCLAQGGYYLITGIWPILAYRSFEAVSGKKTDDWLVKTFGALVAVVGLVLVVLGYKKPLAAETTYLSLLSSLALAAAEFHYVRKRRISRIYLVDAFLECVFAGTYLSAFRRPRRGERDLHTERSTT